MPRHRAVERNRPREAVRVGQAQPVGEGRPLADACQIDALGVDMVVAARLLDRPEDVILDLRVRRAVGAPAEAGPAVGAVAQRLRAAQADAAVGD